MKKINRRDFIKLSGASVAAAGALAACKSVSTESSSQNSENKTGEMVYRQNGDDSVSLLGYGCMRWQMKRDENGRNVVDQESVNELVDYAIAHGVNYFDSAPVYLQGQSERATALALLRYPRESYFIATKNSNQSNWDYDNSINMYKKSLENFETDYIDYYLLHYVTSYDNFKTRYEDNHLIDYFLKERELGHIKNLGFSFHGYKDGFDSLMETVDKYKWDFVQIQMNYVDWTHASGFNCNADYLYEELTKRNIPVVVMEPLLGGQLSNVPNAIAETLKQHEPNKSIASWAFRFVGSYPNILTTLSGMTYMEHLQDNLDTFRNFKALNESEFSMLEEMAGIIRNYPLVPCTDCQYCMPCPYGIDIPSIFKQYNSAVNEGYVVESTESKSYKRLKKKYLTEYSKAIPTLRQADHCIACRECEPHCPQRIRISSQLRRIDEYVENLKQNKF